MISYYNVYILKCDAWLQILIHIRQVLLLKEVLSMLLTYDTRLQQFFGDSNSSAQYADRQAKRGNNNTQNRGSLPRQNRGGTTTTDLLVSRVEGMYGHVAWKCYNQFDQNFQGPPSNNSNAYYATPDNIGNSKWLFDSGATNHATVD